MKPYAVRINTQGWSNELEHVGQYRISQWFWMESKHKPGYYFWMGAVNTNESTIKDRRRSNPLVKDAYEYAGFTIFENDDDAYTHWQSEHSMLDACHDWSDEGKGSGLRYTEKETWAFLDFWHKKTIVFTAQGNIRLGSVVSLNENGTVSSTLPGVTPIGTALSGAKAGGIVTLDLFT